MIDIVSSQPLTDRLKLDIDSNSDLDIEEPQPHESQVLGKAQKAFKSTSNSSINHRLPTPDETISSNSTLSHLYTPFSADSDSAMLEESTSRQAKLYLALC